MDGIRIVDIVENEDDNLISYRVTSEKLREHPEIDLVYIVSAGVAGAVRAVAEQEHPIQVLSFDATEEIASLVRAGEITATICQEPYRQGYRSIYTLFDYLVNGIPPQEEYLYTGCEIKIKENLS